MTPIFGSANEIILICELKNLNPTPRQSFSDMGHLCISSTLEDQELSLQFSCPRESWLSSSQGLESLPV